MFNFLKHKDEAVEGQVVEVEDVEDEPVVKVKRIKKVRADGEPKRAFHRWTEEDVAILTAKYATTDNNALAKTLKRPANLIALKAFSLGLKKDGETRAKILTAARSKREGLWTHKDVQRLNKLFKDGLTYPQIAAELERTVGTVQQKAYHLGLRKYTKVAGQ